MNPSPSIRSSEPLHPEGTRVQALETITEGGQGPGDPQAEFPRPDYIHALKGDEGVIMGIDPALGNLPTVRFDRKGTATLVRWEEIRKISD